MGILDLAELSTSNNAVDTFYELSLMFAVLAEACHGSSPQEISSGRTRLPILPGYRVLYGERYKSTVSMVCNWIDECDTSLFVPPPYQSALELKDREFITDHHYPYLSALAPVVACEHPTVSTEPVILCTPDSLKTIISQPWADVDLLITLSGVCSLSTHANDLKLYELHAWLMYIVEIRETLALTEDEACALINTVSMVQIIGLRLVCETNPGALEAIMKSVRTQILPRIATD